MDTFKPFHYMHSIAINVFNGQGPYMVSAADALKKIYSADANDMAYKMAQEAIYNSGGKNNLIQISQVERPEGQRDKLNNYPANAPIFHSATARMPSGSSCTSAIDEGIQFSRELLQGAPLTMEFQRRPEYGWRSDNIISVTVNGKSDPTAAFGQYFDQQRNGTTVARASDPKAAARPV